MASKNITITEATYEKLQAHKRADERYSDVIERLTTARTSPLDAAGTAPGLGSAVASASDEFEDALTGSDRELSR